MNNAHVWLKATCGDDSFREISRRAGLSDSIISRQLSQGGFTFEVAVSIAREYNGSVLAALVASNLISQEEAGIDAVTTALQAATDEQLVVEIGRRLDVTPSSMLWDAPASDAVDRAANVVSMDDHRAPAYDDLRAVASEESEDRGEDDGYDD